MTPVVYWLCSWTYRNSKMFVWDKNVPWSFKFQSSA